MGLLELHFFLENAVTLEKLAIALWILNHQDSSLNGRLFFKVHWGLCLVEKCFYKMQNSSDFAMKCVIIFVFPCRNPKKFKF